MLIFLYGQDTFSLLRKMREIINAYRQKTKGLNFLSYDANSCDFSDFFSALNQTSLFDEKKLIIVCNVLEKKFKEKAQNHSKTIAASAHNIIFCQEGKVLKADKMLALAKKTGKVEEFAPLEGADLEQWVAAEFGTLGKKINRQAIAVLCQRLGNDLWQLSNEIQRLGHAAEGDEITVQDIARFIKQAVDLNIFKTVDALAAKDKKTALRLIHKHIAGGDHPLYLLAMISNQMRNLLAVKYYLESQGGGYSQDGGAASLGMHPFVFSKTARQSRQFDMEKLKEIFNLLVRFDADIKIGKIDAGVALDLIIAGV